MPHAIPARALAPPARRKGTSAAGRRGCNQQPISWLCICHSPQTEEKLRKLIVAAAIAAGCLVGPAYAATDAECQDMWKKADANNDGVLTDAEAQRYSA